MSFRKAIEDYIAREARPVDKFGHQPRMYALAVQVGEGFEYDADIVHAAVWLHDLGVFAGHRPEDLEELARWDNVRYAMDLAPRVLAEAGFPAHRISAVVEAIRTHQPSGDPQTIEGAIVRDADILEQLGAIAVLRQVAKVGRDTRFPTFTPAVATLRKALDTLPAAIRLETTRALAAPRIESLRRFLDAATSESEGGLF